MGLQLLASLMISTQVSGRLGMSGGISPRHAQNPLSGERRKTLSITHHALSPPPSHHHLYIIHLINWLQRFYRIIMSLKRPFVPKSDVKQWFTTTTLMISVTSWRAISLITGSFSLLGDRARMRGRRTLFKDSCFDHHNIGFIWKISFFNYLTNCPNWSVR